jgi:CheY-like chemotaxis protein
MPVMNGREAITHIRQHRRDLPIVMQTAYARMEDKDEAMKAGCDEYLSKPIKQEELFMILKKYNA